MEIVSTLALLAVYVCLGVPAALIGIPWSAMTGRTILMYRMGMSIIALGLRVAGIRVEVVGRERVPVGRQVIYMVNHVSNLDPPVVLPVLPGQCSVLLKQELMRIPILGYAMKQGMFVPVERSARRDAARASVEAAAKALGAGLNMLVFPEGTRSSDGRLAAFKKGPFYLAQETGAPIVPVAIAGTERLMRKGSPWVHRGGVRVEFLAPVEPAAFVTRDELMRAVREAIADALPEAMKPSVPCA